MSMSGVTNSEITGPRFLMTNKARECFVSSGSLFIKSVDRRFFLSRQEFRILLNSRIFMVRRFVSSKRKTVIFVATARLVVHRVCFCKGCYLCERPCNILVDSFCRCFLSRF